MSESMAGRVARYSAWLETAAGTEAFCRDILGSVMDFFRVGKDEAKRIYDAYLDDRLARAPKWPMSAGMRKLLANPDGYGWHDGTGRVSCHGIEMSEALRLSLEFWEEGERV